MKSILFTCLLVLCSAVLSAQGFPKETTLSPDGRMLLTGKTAPGGWYDSATIRTINLDFPQSNYWSLLTANYQTHTDLLAKMTVDGVVYDSVGVRFKGQTSYSMNNTEKKSFNITMDYLLDNQDIMGYQTLNLNNAFQDASFLREVFYQHQIRRHIPTAKSNFVQLYINGQNWGIYPNVQQLNKTMLREWFFSSDGAFWRADRPDGTSGGGPGGGGPGWGDGTAALNYLGADTATYQKYYILKSSEQDKPWNLLIEAANALNNTPTDMLTTVLPDYLDIDRTLWLLASEIAFTDDDSYVYKGKMDYYLYYEAETGLMFPMEYDGNSAMETNLITTWSPFYNANKVNYPLLNKILAVPEWRQRYLAHLRTIISEEMNPTVCTKMLDNYKAMISTLVQEDPKKIYSFAQFNTEVTTLKNFVTNRVNYLNSNAEVSQVAPVIQSANLFNSAGAAWQQPIAGEQPNVQAMVTAPAGISAVTLYYTSQLTGHFETTPMFDDGQHNDGAANDGLYGANLPAQIAGTWVRFYIAATANTTAKSVSYLPTGAEHDVFVYQVQSVALSSPIVINEIMAVNTNTATDESGAYEDWIELYNNSNQNVSLEGYTLSDNAANLTKYTIPSGVNIAPNGYLIFWADEDASVGPMHCNFKLAGSGETLYLLNKNTQIIDSVTFGQQLANRAYARTPNGTGQYMIQSPTFNANNDLSAISDIDRPAPSFHLAPNPSGTTTYIRLEMLQPDSYVTVRDIHGRLVSSFKPQKTIEPLSVVDWAKGVYIVEYAHWVQKLVVQ
jgi:CotH kinase protein/Lamin Tail Domain